MVASFRWSQVEDLPLALYTWMLLEAEALHHIAELISEITSIHPKVH